MKEILKITDLRKTFNLSLKQRKLEGTNVKKKVAVDGLSFSAYEGEIYGLLGPNGAGKTTTLRVISTLIKADEGDVFVDGISVKENPDEVRKRIGFMTSEMKMEGFFTPNYLFDFFSELHNVPEQVKKSRKDMLFKKFGIDKFAEVKISDLSTGMKQKVSLAIALVNDPKILVFDEPTSGLDVITAKVVTDFLLSLKEEGRTIIISTHIFSLVEKVCDRVGIVIDGKMKVSDTIGNIMGGKSLEEAFFEIYKGSEGKEQ
ncbi:MAG: putative ABC transporter ATP-binding protein YbhF [Firmicutes bacterium ADurb.Bin080]|mgnify:CR=1 FL=1|jgi:sodium transport system ATP-binding protein|nr:ABC transporter ATP-binding protein [Clostridiales bacterium]OQC11867.1 MAG: putative ABC transporter ATP-binding protein YbhF [Firmicutes bacterium ADurb.Bin080]